MSPKTKPAGLLETSGPAVAPDGEPLDEVEVDRLAQEAAHADAQHGSTDPRTADAKSRCESELERWKRAAERAADNGNYEEFERITDVTHRVGSLLRSLESPAPGGFLASAMAQDSSEKTQDSAPPESTPASGRTGRRTHAEKEEKRRSKKDKKDKAEKGSTEDAKAFSDTSAPKSNFEPDAFSSTMAAIPETRQASMPAEWDAGGSSPPWGPTPSFDLSKPAAFPSVPAQTSNDSGMPSMVTPLPATASSTVPSRTQLAGPAPESDVGRCAQLEAQVQILQANNMTLQAQLAQSQQQLSNAFQRLREVEHPRSDLADARASLSNMREVQTQLQSELEHLRRELQQRQSRMETAEVQAAEREIQLTQTRNRLFDEKRRCGQLQDEIQGMEAMHASLQGKLQEERLKSASLERDLLCIQQTFGTARVPSLVCADASVPRASNGVPYRLESEEVARKGMGDAQSNSSFTIREDLPKVNKQDELAESVPLDTRAGVRRNMVRSGEPPLQQLARHNRVDDSNSNAHSLSCDNSTGELNAGKYESTFNNSSRLTFLEQLCKSDNDSWARTPRVNKPHPVLIDRTPPASRGLIETMATNFRNLLARPRGPLYEDEHVRLELSITCANVEDVRTSFRCNIEANVVNESTQPIDQVMLQAVGAAGEYAPFSMKLSPLGSSRILQPHENCVYRGLFEASTPYEVWPQAELSYLLPDGLCCKTRFRFPLMVMQFITPARPSSDRFKEVWNLPEFLQHEVAFICTVRSTFLDAGGYFFYTKCLELGGLLCPLPGLDPSPQGLALAAAHVATPRCTSKELLVRAELGSPRGEKGACRVVIRSASYLLNRGLARVLLDALCSA